MVKSKTSADISPARGADLLALAREVSVVIPLGPDRGDQLERLMKALEVQTVRPAEVLVEEGLNAYINRNRGWRRAAGRIIWFLDSDVVPEPDGLEKALEIFAKTDPEGVEGRIYGVISRVFEWGYMSGHILYTREALEKAGGFDEWFTDWRGDTDLAWTVLDGGGIILYQPLSRACHPEPSSTQVDMAAERRLFEKHPERYREARAGGFLQCFIWD